MSGIDWDRFLPLRSNPNLPEIPNDLGIRTSKSPIIKDGLYAGFKCYGPYKQVNSSKNITYHYILERKNGSRVKISRSKFDKLYPDGVRNED